MWITAAQWFGSRRLAVSDLRTVEGLKAHGEDEDVAAPPPPLEKWAIKYSSSSCAIHRLLPPDLDN